MTNESPWQSTEFLNGFKEGFAQAKTLLVNISPQVPKVAARSERSETKPLATASGTTKEEADCVNWALAPRSARELRAKYEPEEKAFSCKGEGEGKLVTAENPMRLNEITVLGSELDTLRSQISSAISCLQYSMKVIQDMR